MIVIVMGVSGAGKTSVARSIATRADWVLIEGDDLHPASNRAKMAAGTPLTDEDRWPWLDAIAAEAQHLETAGNSVVVACSALKSAYRDRLRRAGPNVRFVHLVGTPELIGNRMHARKDHFMPPGLLASQFATLETPTVDERALTFDILLPVETIAERTIARLLG